MARRPPSPTRSPARCDALGRRAREAMPDSQSASEQGESAKRERALRTRLASSGGQLTQRSERDARRANARAALERNEALVWQRIFGRKSKTSRSGSCRAKDNKDRRHGLKTKLLPLSPKRIFGRKSKTSRAGSCRAKENSERPHPALAQSAPHTLFFSPLLSPPLSRPSPQKNLRHSKKKLDSQPQIA